MKTIIILSISFLSFIISSCENKCDVEKTIEQLRSERYALQTEVAGLDSRKIESYSEIARLDEKLKELKIYESGSVPQYFMEFSFTPTTLRLTNVAINSFSLQIPIDKRFYEQHNAGESYGRMRIKNKWVSK